MGSEHRVDEGVGEEVNSKKGSSRNKQLEEAPAHASFSHPCPCAVYCVTMVSLGFCYVQLRRLGHGFWAFGEGFPA